MNQGARPGGNRPSWRLDLGFPASRNVRLNAPVPSVKYLSWWHFVMEALAD